jgi:hypothetical protein
VIRREVIWENLSKIADAGFDRIVVVATSPEAVPAYQKAIAAGKNAIPVQLSTWLDISWGSTGGPGGTSGM